MADETTERAFNLDPLGDWFRKIGTALSSEDYEEGIRLLAAAKAEAWDQGNQYAWRSPHDNPYRDSRDDITKGDDRG